MTKQPRAFDIFGNIALVKFPKETKVREKKNFAEDILKRYKSVRTILEKTGKFKGRLRKQETKHIAGEKTKEALYTENGCTFRLNTDETYFSPRLNSERKEIADKIKKGETVLVMFAGIAPYPIVIAKNSRAEKIYSNEINKKANIYAKQNIELNKLKNRVFLLPGDIKKLTQKITDNYKSKLFIDINNRFYVNSQKNRANTNERTNLQEVPTKFTTIVMPRPQLKDTFLKEAFALSKKGTRIYYYDFCKDDEVNQVLEKIKGEAKKARKKIKILRTKRAGEIAPYKCRIRVDLKIL
ncbi:MAG: hypothetical protein KKB79_03475 [Nanoarchaeota archaeon]|nr:hypothetical protein [Nanoarchaeota archaeon]